MTRTEQAASPQMNWCAVHAELHQLHLDTVRADCIHVADTPDGIWGLFVQRHRPPSAASGLSVHAVRYVLTEDLRWDKVLMTHTGEGFGGSAGYYWLAELYPQAMAAWDAALRRLYPTIPCRAVEPLETTATR